MRRVKWDGIEGTVTGDGPHGRIEVTEDNGTVHHIQPAWVEEVPSLTDEEHTRLSEPLGPEPCPHPKDALGCCTGPCAGEDWER